MQVRVISGLQMTKNYTFLNKLNASGNNFMDLDNKKAS